MGADLIREGPKVLHQVLPPQHPCHIVTALLRNQDKVLLLASSFSRGRPAPSPWTVPPGHREGFPAGALELGLLSLTVVHLWVLHVPSGRAHIDSLGLICGSSSHCHTVHSVPVPLQSLAVAYSPSLCVTKPFSTVVLSYSNNLFSPNSIPIVSLLFFVLFFLLPPNSALVLAIEGKGTRCQ